MTPPRWPLEERRRPAGYVHRLSDIPDLQTAGLQVLKVNSGYDEGIYFYLDPKKGNPALQDVRVRQAIVMAIDRNAITKNLLLGLTQPAATIGTIPLM